MKSTWEIKQQMERELGKDFIRTMEEKKGQFEEFQKQLKEAESFEQKVQNKQNELCKNFISISDNYNIYPEEICNNSLYTFAKECVERKLSKKEQEEKQQEYQQNVIDILEDEIKTLQEIINSYKEVEE